MERPSSSPRRLAGAGEGAAMTQSVIARLTKRVKLDLSDTDAVRNYLENDSVLHYEVADHIASLEARLARAEAANTSLADCLDCARQDWEGNNGEIIDKNDPHWSVEARRLVARSLSQNGEG